MVAGTLSLVQKCQTRGCSGHSTQWNSGIWWWGNCLWCKKVKAEDAVDAVHSTQWNSGMWWWGHCLWCKKVKPVDSVDTVCSGIVVYGGGDIVLWCKNVKRVDAVCSGHSGIVIYGGGDIVFCTKRSNQWMQWTQYTVDNVPTTIYHYSTASTVYCVHCVLCPLCIVSTASTGLTFLHQRQCPHHHISLFCCVLHPLCTASTGLTFLHQGQCPTIIYHYSTAYCIHWFDLFVSKTMSPPPHNTIPLHTASTAYCVNCIHYVLCPLCDCIH